LNNHLHNDMYRWFFPWLVVCLCTQLYSKFPSILIISYFFDPSIILIVFGFFVRFYLLSMVFLHLLILSISLCPSTQQAVMDALVEGFARAGPVSADARSQMADDLQVFELHQRTKQNHKARHATKTAIALKHGLCLFFHNELRGNRAI